MINNKKTAARALSVIMTALMLTACSKEEQVDYTEAENALQASLVGYWTDDIELFEKTVAEENSAVSVLEFTEDYNYLWHECDFAEWQIKTYEPTEYSFEELMIKIDNNGEEAFAKLELSSDGETLYWITDEHTYDYTRVSEDVIKKIGVPKQEAEKPAESTAAVTDDVSESESTTETDIQLNGSTSPSGYVLDPNYKFDESDAEMEFTQHAVLIAEADNTRIYGVYPDESEPLIFIEQGNVIDEFEQNWLTPRNVLPAAEWMDIDNDGDDELVVDYYIASGTGLSISELVVYERGGDGHFTAHKLDAESLVDEYVNYYIDSENDWIDFAAYYNDEIYSTSTANDYPDGIDEISFGTDISFEFNGDRVKLYTTPSTSMLRYECMPKIVADVTFDGEKFDLENIDFTDNE